MIQCQNVYKRFNKKTVINRINLEYLTDKYSDYSVHQVPGKLP